MTHMYFNCTCKFLFLFFLFPRCLYLFFCYFMFKTCHQIDLSEMTPGKHRQKHQKTDLLWYKILPKTELPWESWVAICSVKQRKWRSYQCCAAEVYILQVRCTTTQTQLWKHRHNENYLKHQPWHCPFKKIPHQSIKAKLFNNKSPLHSVASI